MTRLRVLIRPGVDEARARRLGVELLPRLGIGFRISETDAPAHAAAAATLAFVPPGAPRTQDERSGTLLELPLGDPWIDVAGLRATWVGDVPVLHPSGATPRTLVDDGRVAFPILEAMEFLLRREEELVPERDPRGRFRPEYSIVDELGLAPFAAIERGIDALAAWLVERAPNLERRGWDGARFVVALTHDVDSVTSGRPSLRKAEHLLRSGLAARRGLALESGAGEVARVLSRGTGVAPFNFLPWWQLEADAGVGATYHFFGDYERDRDPDDAWYRYEDRGLRDGAQQRLADVMRDMARRGVDVGLHASIASFDDPDRLRRESASLARAIDAEPVSVRCHHLRFDARRSAPAFVRAGLRFDSSVGGVGFTKGTAFPYEVPAGADGSLIEIPTVAMDHILVKDARHGLPSSLARRRIERILGEVRDRNGGVAVLFHPDVDEKLELYRWTIAWIRDNGGSCVTARDLGERWLRRTRPSDA